MSTPIGIFDPVRLLREDWESPRALAEELYAMVTAKAPPAINESKTVRVPEGPPEVRVERIQEGDTFVEGNRSAIAKNSVSTSPNVPGRRAAPNPFDALKQRTPQQFADLTPTLRPFQAARDFTSSAQPLPQPGSPLYDAAPAPVGSGLDGPVQFSSAPIVVSPNSRRDVSDVAKPAAARASTPDQIVPPVGTILSGSGQFYQVQLQNNGPLADPSGSIQVRFTMLSDFEILDPGTLIWDIRQYQGFYYGFVPTWG